MWKALVYATLIIMMHTVLGDYWAVRLRCLWAGRGLQFLFTRLLFEKRRTTMNSTLLLTDWSTRLHFPTVLDRHVIFIITQNALLCLWTPESRWRWFWNGQLPRSISEGPGVQEFNFRTALPLLQAPDSKTFRLICSCVRIETDLFEVY